MPRKSSSYAGESRKSKKELTAAADRGAALAAPAVQPTLPSEEEEREKRVPATGDAKGGDESSAVSQQILNFLLGLKTLKRYGAESRQELEQALYAKRFELLFPESEKARQDTPTALANRAPLPQFHALPQQQLLKEFLMSGKLLGGHQSVAHVLYPEAVHWPQQLGACADEDATGQRDLGTTGGSDAPDILRPTTAPRRQSAEIVEPEEGAGSDEEEEKVEVVLCGKRVQSTVRGRALKDVLVDRALVAKSPKGVQPLPEARFRAAQETRKHLERQVKMEEYQERRIAERIQALELALDDEDVVTGYVLSPNFSLKSLRSQKNKAKPFFDMTRADSPSSVSALEDNYAFVLALAVTYAPDGCFPPHRHFKEVFVDIADTYGIFPEKTMRRDWAHYTGGQARNMGIHALSLASRSEGTRSEKVALLKKAIHMAIVEGHHSCAAPHEAGRDPLDLAKNRFEKVLRQAEPDVGDKKDTQATPNLPKASPTLAPDVTVDKVDGCLGNRQVMKAVVRGSKRPSEDGQAEIQENENGEPVKVKKPRGAAKAKSAAAKAAGKATAVKAAAKKRTKPTDSGEASAASPADHGEVSAASPSDAKPDEGAKPNEDAKPDDGTKRLAVKEQWDLKDRVWWAVDQMYVNVAKGKLSPGIKQNAKGGVTLSVLKYGGWADTFGLARQIANWPTPTVEPGRV
eukprot:s2026_g4.t1